MARAVGSGRVAFCCTELLRGEKGALCCSLLLLLGWRRQRRLPPAARPPRQRSGGGRRLLCRRRRLGSRLLGGGSRRRGGLALTLGGGGRLSGRSGLLGLRHRDELKLNQAQVVVQLGLKAVAAGWLNLAPLRCAWGGAG